MATSFGQSAAFSAALARRAVIACAALSISISQSGCATRLWYQAGLWLMPPAWLSRRQTLVIAAFFVAFLLFCSANQFARLQWNTGLRYLLPLVPFCFLYTVPVLERLPALARRWLLVAAVAQAWALAMARESVPDSLLRVFVAGPAALVAMLRQRSRPYLFSNSLPPPIVGASLAAFDLLDESPELVRRLRENTRFFREGLRQHGFDVPDGVHPVVPILVGETALAIALSKELLAEGVYVSGFGFPVVPHGEARLRAQISAAHEREDLSRALDAIARVGSRHGVVA